MSDSVWLYRLGHVEYGPFTAEEMVKKLQGGELDEETFVKGEGYTEWKPLKEIKELNVDYLDVAPPIVKLELETHNRAFEEQLRHWTRPWIRFWARMIDYSLFYLFIVGCMQLIQRPALFSPWILPTLLTFFWVFLEAGLLSAFGSTPGKWFLQIKLLPKSKRLSYADALRRALSVWLWGMGAALPIIWIIPAVISNVKLSNSGITRWDKAAEIEVQHKRIGFWRTFFTILFFILFVALINKTFA